MKKNELMEVRKSDNKTITERVKKLRMDLIDLKMSLRVGKLTNFKEIKNKRRDLAQILTILNQKKLVEELEKQNA